MQYYIYGLIFARGFTKRGFPVCHLNAHCNTLVLGILDYIYSKIAAVLEVYSVAKISVW